MNLKKENKNNSCMDEKYPRIKEWKKLPQDYKTDRFLFESSPVIKTMFWI